MCADDDDDDDDDDGVFCARACAWLFVVRGLEKKMEKWKTLHSSGKRRVVLTLARALLPLLDSHTRAHIKNVSNGRARKDKNNNKKKINNNKYAVKNKTKHVVRNPAQIRYKTNESQSAKRSAKDQRDARRAVALSGRGAREAKRETGKVNGGIGK